IKEVMCHTMEVVAKLESNTHFEAWQFLTPQEQLDVMETYAKQGEQLVQSMDQLVTNVGNATSVQVVEKGVEIILDCATARVVGKLATGATSLAAKRLVPLLKEAEVIHETEKFAALEGRLVKAGEKVAAATEKSIA
ncbi:MAG: hypothetical protein NTX86_00535, partial [Candidatus Dependentiae bacterium]|nr:hypothetical protein [Candidatus Dependentiae bacterium]